MPIFSEIAPITFKTSRFESKISENENHKFTIFQTNQYGKREKRIKDLIHLITLHFILKVHASQFVFYRIIFSKKIKYHQQVITVKPVLSGHSKEDKTQVFKTSGSLMQVESIAE